MYVKVRTTTTFTTDYTELQYYRGATSKTARISNLLLRRRHIGTRDAVKVLSSIWRLLRLDGIRG